jgi:hypothetical protein
VNRELNPPRQISYEAARADLDRQIADRYGTDPEVLAGLNIQIRTKPCPRRDGKGGGFLLCAFPLEADGDSARLMAAMMVAYFGDTLDGAG